MPAARPRLALPRGPTLRVVFGVPARGKVGHLRCERALLSITRVRATGVPDGGVVRRIVQPDSAFDTAVQVVAAQLIARTPAGEERDPDRAGGAPVVPARTGLRDDKTCARRP